MDGASKFVKGDAIAAIVITLINLIGGFAIGVVQQHMSFGERCQQLQPAHRRRRSGHADPGAADLALDRPDRHPGQRPRTTSGTDLLQPVRGASTARPAARRRAACCARRLGARACRSSPFLHRRRAALLRSPRGCRRRPATDARAVPAEVGRVRRRARRARGIWPARCASSRSSSSSPLDLVDLVDAHGRRPARPRPALRRKLAARTRPGHPARAHPRQHRPALEHVHDPRARRGGRPRQAPPDRVLVHRRRIDAAARTRRPSSRCSGWPPVGCRSSSAIRPSWPGATVVDRSSVITTHLAEVVRRNAGRLLGRRAAHAARPREADRPRRGRGAGCGQPRSERDPAGAARAARRRACRSVTWVVSSRR